MEKIRICSGVKIIEVNDNGETISLPVGDDDFLKRLYELIRKAEEESQKVSVSQDDILGSMETIVSFDKAMLADVDTLFGPGTCKKVFGDILPGCEMFVEFFEALMPFFEAHQKDRAKKLNKYSAGRVGSSV